jgi:hypothetical protein
MISASFSKAKCNAFGSLLAEKTVKIYYAKMSKNVPTRDFVNTRATAFV